MRKRNRCTYLKENSLVQHLLVLPINHFCNLSILFYQLSSSFSILFQFPSLTAHLSFLSSFSQYSSHRLYFFSLPSFLLRFVLMHIHENGGSRLIYLNYVLSHLFVVFLPFILPTSSVSSYFPSCSHGCMSSIREGHRSRYHSTWGGTKSLFILTPPQVWKRNSCPCD